MYALSISTVKSPQLCSRVCMKGCCRVNKLTCGNSSMDKMQGKKEWWKLGVQNVFGKYLLLTNTVSSGFLMAVGDLIQQEFEYVNDGRHTNSFDWHRNKLRFFETLKTLTNIVLMVAGLVWFSMGEREEDKHLIKTLFPVNMGIVGTFQGPLAHFFYQILDKYFPGVKMSTIMKKIFLDQTIASPLCIILFFWGMNYLGSQDFETSKTELKEKFWVVYAVDCSVWIPAQFFNFYCLSSKYRVIYINLLTMCYNVFLSFMKHTHNST